MRPSCFLFVAASLLAGAAAASESSFEGENLLTPFVPATDQWDLYVLPSNLGSMLWKLKANADDQYGVQVFRKYKKPFKEYRYLQDEPGLRSCVTFDTFTVDESSVNGYPRLIWRTRCKLQDSSRASMVHAVIQGRDALYHVQKVWQFDVAETEVQVWLERIKQNLVCDPRNKEHPCPEGYSRVGAGTGASVGSSDLPDGALQAGSLANAKLIADVTVGVVAKLATLGCSKMDAQLPFVTEMPRGKPGSRRWQELWLVQGCGAEHSITIDFKEAGPSAADWKIK